MGRKPTVAHGWKADLDPTCYFGIYLSYSSLQLR